MNPKLNTINLGRLNHAANPNHNPLKKQGGQGGQGEQGGHAPSPSTPTPPDLEITPEFTHALQLIHQKTPFVFVTGRAGVGKTTFINWIRQRLEGNVAVVAPTGLAAITAGGQTIHSFFKFPPHPVDLDTIRKARARSVFEHLDVLIIDEISMVRADLMDAIERHLSINGPSPGRAFGGVRVVGVGDLYQLPPIVQRGDEHAYLTHRYRTPYFFSAACLQDTEVAPVELTKVFRQKDEHFLSLLNAIREGKNHQPAIAELNTACNTNDNINEHPDEHPDDTYTALVPRRQTATEINDRHLANLPGDHHEYQGNIEGEFFSARTPIENLSDTELDRRLPSPYRLRLKPGARVIFTKNDYARGLVNGTTGTVLALTPDMIEVQVTNTSTAKNRPRTVNITPVTWARQKYVWNPDTDKLETETIGAYTQFPLILGWAMTIHKAQGQTLDHALIDLQGGAFAEGQAYVALSRCRSIEGLRLARPIHPSDIKTDPRIQQFHQALANHMAD